ncbi:MULTISPECIES: polymerase [unclassified Mesorhizobium]|uniref:polymerase n=1 Tax=unclassified Mesorhizobium TaxID=325217 RepID=UPI000BAE8505|nr:MULTISPECIES: polymerase [unclassified Mesorhizobium]TGT60971.1 polymerase [Mesorhizobium sp. M00.F.Ca.ET.170.01.1.1]AZO08737.1 polymerase [Mesorhizobium sp. M3A.F.Ca.ET.080.04.2.1]PBB84114.1 polymerase [Mesorhizobium sp. WSM3876]RWB72138.1 MAG: polymerase [Mesorhizobium sp.]RWB83657.1 MAG: polymerase [Mesorhizobium sp.]
MQPGEMIANAFAVLLLAGLIAGIFLAFGRPLWPEPGAQMVVLLPVDPSTTGSMRQSCMEPCLPFHFDLSHAPARPQR